MGSCSPEEFKLYRSIFPKLPTLNIHPHLSELFAAFEALHKARPALHIDVLAPPSLLIWVDWSLTFSRHCPNSLVLGEMKGTGKANGRVEAYGKGDGELGVCGQG